MSITSKAEVRIPNSEPKSFSYDEMIKTKGIFMPEVTADFRVINLHGIGNIIDSTKRPLLLSTRNSGIESLSTTAWTGTRFIQVEEEITITFSGKVP